MKRQNVSTGRPTEATLGYCRAVRVGDIIHVAGTGATNPDLSIVAPGDAYAQAKHIFGIIEGALKEAGAEMRHVVRTRVFLTNAADFQAVGKAHGEVFRDIRPACTIIGGIQMVLSGMVVEIEADAIISD